MPNTVSLCMIVKNDVENMNLLINSLAPVLEEIVIVDTGSTDGTIEKIKEISSRHSNVKLHHFEWVDHFSKARNFSFSKATQDWVFWLDSDDAIDVVKLKNFKDNYLDKPNVDLWILNYVYARYQDGTPAMTLGRERFIRRSKNPTWGGAIHEAISMAGMRTSNYHDLDVIHERHKRKYYDPNRNLRILEKEYAANPTDTRNTYYYGKELFDHINDKGISILEGYLTLPGKYWDDEVNARFRLGLHYLVHNRLPEVVHMASGILIADNESRPEYYWLMAELMVRSGKHEEAKSFFDRCLKCGCSSPRVINREYSTWHPKKKMAECDMALRIISDDTIRLINEIKSKRELNLLVGGDNWPPIESKAALNRTETRPSNLGGTEYKLTAAPGTVLPLKKQSFDIIIDKEYDLSLAEYLKEGGTLYLEKNIDNLPEFGRSKKTTNYHKFVKIKSDSPLVKFSVTEPTDNGPLRIRVYTAYLSAIENGIRAVNSNNPKKADVQISNRLTSSEGADYNILDVCEKIDDKEYYLRLGIGYCDLVTAASNKLKEHINSLFPKVKVEVIADHYEF